MSWLNPIAPISPMAMATGMMRLFQRAAAARATSMKPNTPAADSSTDRVGCSRNDSNVVPTRVVNIDSSDHAYNDSTPRPSAAARTDPDLFPGSLRSCPPKLRQASHTVPSMHSAPSSENCSIGKVSTAPSPGR
jgi:hypothetical protein